MRESDEDVESEIERSIFNIVVPTRVGRERLFTCRQTTTGNGIWTKLRLGTGIWYTPLQDRLIILLLSYISTRTVVQIVQLLNNGDTLF